MVTASEDSTARCHELLALAVAKNAERLDDELYLAMTSAEHRRRGPSRRLRRRAPSRRRDDRGCLRRFPISHTGRVLLAGKSG